MNPTPPFDKSDEVMFFVYAHQPGTDMGWFPQESSTDQSQAQEWCDRNNARELFTPARQYILVRRTSRFEQINSATALPPANTEAETKTKETDALENKLGGCSAFQEWVDFARKLERERDAALAELALVAGQLDYAKNALPLLARSTVDEENALKAELASEWQRREEAEKEIEQYRSDLHFACAAKQTAIRNFEEADNDRRQLSDDLKTAESELSALTVQIERCTEVAQDFYNLARDLETLLHDMADALTVTGTRCWQVHHDKKDQHSIDQPCPVEQRIDALLARYAELRKDAPANEKEKI